MAATFTRSQPPGSATLATAGQLGQAAVDGQMPYISGVFVKFGAWGRVDSQVEGRFVERWMPGAFERSIREDRGRIRILYDHGMDSFLGRRPIASLDGLGADEMRAWYFGRLFDNLGGHELMAGLQAGQYGSSLKFQVARQQADDRPKRSDSNPEGLPERSIIEANLIELGPTPFPVFAGTSAGTSSGQHPPRSVSHSPISQGEFARLLRDGPRDTPEKRRARERWLDKVSPR